MVAQRLSPVDLVQYKLCGNIQQFELPHPEKQNESSMFGTPPQPHDLVGKLKLRCILYVNNYTHRL